MSASRVPPASSLPEPSPEAAAGAGDAAASASRRHAEPGPGAVPAEHAQHDGPRRGPGTQRCGEAAGSAGGGARLAPMQPQRQPQREAADDGQVCSLSQRQGSRQTHVVSVWDIKLAFCFMLFTGSGTPFTLFWPS